MFEDMLDIGKEGISHKKLAKVLCTFQVNKQSFMGIICLENNVLYKLEIDLYII